MLRKQQMSAIPNSKPSDVVGTIYGHGHARSADLTWHHIILLLGFSQLAWNVPCILCQASHLLPKPGLNADSCEAEGLNGLLAEPPKVASQSDTLQEDRYSRMLFGLRDDILKTCRQGCYFASRSTFSLFGSGCRWYLLSKHQHHERKTCHSPGSRSMENANCCAV